MRHHGAGLRRLLKDDALVTQIERDYATSPITPADRAMLDYAAKLTRAPAKITRDDVDLLRVAGFSDSAILDICQVTAYYAFANRLADGLGIELEAFWDDGER